ncbi:carboxymuconolactone decarboxylase family protein [Actinokineospora sp. NBRC 105648]|uniref:carboxymuconolactone decarboxylase family protein n=1 Tax=Actinokineospora sp. NBRC 105648 TaxID=3032206 RepID=UPI00249FDEA7|nr:carboxymuconolactone decarboxylase family protein [Actinokineospora sp. NBRC 105648]GLZ36447.1 alkyl hydroperoxide reductase AhpD [Actinokineospora sp. NBRC 105648]
MTTQRVAAIPAAPELYKKLIALHTAVEHEAVAAGLDQKLIELVKIRASQINGCAFCIDMHSTAASKLGEDIRRIHALPAFRESGFFTAREEAALALTESVTLLAETRVPDDVYEAAAKEFSEAELTQLIWAITVINAFNRLSVTSRNTPPPL